MGITSTNIPIKELTPEEYLELAADEERHSAWATQFQLVVTGTVNLTVSALKSRIRHLPSAKILGSLIASDCKKLKSVSCHVQGDALLDGTGIMSLGGGFFCNGKLVARNCRSLASVKGAFPRMVDLGESGVERLGADFSCGENLHVDGCQRLVELNCMVVGSVDAAGSSISKFGANFSCGGNLDLVGCPNIKKLGAIKGPPQDLRIGKSGIAQIDPSFRCNGDLVARDSDHLTSLSGNIGGAIHIERASKLERVTQMSAGGRVCFAECPELKHLDLTVKGGLYLHGCGISSLEPRVIVGGELAISSCPYFTKMKGGEAWDVHLGDLSHLEEIRTDFRCEGNLTVTKCPQLTRLGGRVGGDAEIDSLRWLTSLDGGFSTGGNLTLKGLAELNSLGCSVGGNLKAVKLPKLRETRVEFRVVGSLEFEECPRIKTLRGRVEGDVKIRRAGELEKIGADFECGGDLKLEECPSMKSMNCEVVGDVSLAGCGAVKLGPAFGCGGKFALEVIEVNEGEKGKHFQDAKAVWLGGARREGEKPLNRKRSLWSLGYQVGDRAPHLEVSVGFAENAPLTRGGMGFGRTGSDGSSRMLD